MFHCIYKSTTGQIVSSGICPIEEVPSWCKQDESWVLVNSLCDGLRQYIHGGAVVEMPPRPSNYHFFDYSVKQWIPNLDLCWSAVRERRDQKLLESDWTQLPDVPLETKNAWATYRQALRDVTQQTDPFNIVWPEKP